MNAEHKAVFLSYASQDAEAAKRICDALRQAGVEVWFDQSELVGGDQWDQKIRGQIGSCALFVPIISANTQARLEGYFRIEWKLAAQRTHAMADEMTFLLPVVIDETRDAEAKVPAEFKSVQWTKLPGGETPAAFTQRVKRLLDGGASSREPGSPSPNPVSRGISPPPGRHARWLVPAVLGGLLVMAGIGVWLALRSAPTTADSALEPKSQTPDPSPGAATLRRVEAILDRTDVTRAELDLAGQLLARATQTDPASAPLFAAWARVDCRYIREHYDGAEARKDSARRHVTQAVALAPQLPEVRLARAISMQQLAGSGAKAEVLKVWQELAAERPADRSVLIALAQSYDDVNDQSAAFTTLARAESLPGSKGDVLFARALMKIFANDFADGLRLLQEATSREPAVKYLLWRAYLETIWLGDTDRARRTLAQVPADYFLEDFPASAKFSVELCARDYEAALATIRGIPRDYVQSNAGAYPTGYLWGMVLKLMGRSAAAESAYRAALGAVEQRLAVERNDQSLLMSQAVLLAALGQHDAAAKVWTAVTELYGPARSAWLTLYYAHEQYTRDEMVAMLAQAESGSRWLTAAMLRISPLFDGVRDDPRFSALLAAAEADPKRSPVSAAKAAAPLSEARRQIQRATEIFERPSGSQRESLDSAAELAGRAIGLDPTDEEVLGPAARIDAWMIYMGYDRSAERRQQAQQRAARALALAPDSRAARWARAAVFAFADGSPAMLAEGEAILRSLATESGNRRLLADLGTVLRDENKFEEAAAVFERADDPFSAGWNYLAAGKIDDARHMALGQPRRPGSLNLRIAIGWRGAEDLAATYEIVNGLTAEELLDEDLAGWATLIFLARSEPERAIRVLNAFPPVFFWGKGTRAPKRYFTGRAYALLGNADAARLEWHTALNQVRERLKSAENDLDLLGWQAVLLACLGEKEEAERVRSLFVSMAKANAAGIADVAVYNAVALAELGRNNEALAALSAALLAKESGSSSLHAFGRFAPEFSALRGDPRFERLLRETLPPGARPFDDPKSINKPAPPASP